MTERRVEPEQNEGPVLMEHLSTSLMKSAAESIAQSAMAIGDIPRRFGARIALEPAVSPHLRVELQRFKVALNQVGQPDTTYQYRLFTTRRLAAPEQGTVWMRYVRGVKLLDTDPFVAEYRPQIEDLLSSEKEVREKQGLTGYELQEVLEEMDVSFEKAGDLFLEQVRVSLRQLIQTSAPLEERSRSSRETWGTEETLQQSVLAGIQQVVGAQPQWSTTEKAETPQKGVLADIQQVVRFLERLLEQARQYAVDLVVMLEHYLTVARRLVSEVQAERQLAADERAIEQTLTKLDPQEIISRLSAVPVYMHHGQDEEGTALDTAIIPQFQNQTLNNSYQWFWVQLIQVAREQALIPSEISPVSPG